VTFTIDELLDLWGHPWQPGPAAEAAFRRLYADPVLINGTPTTAAGLVDRAIALQAALADQRREVLHVVETTDAVAVAFRLTGRHVGPLGTKLGVLAATHRMVTLTVMDILVLEQGRVRSIWMVGDELGTLAALGAVVLHQPGSA
jgi:predicted ester cyclase